MADSPLRSAVCRCGEPVSYIRMKKSGKLMPVSEGIVVVLEPDEPVLLITKDGELIRTKERGASGYEPHWSRCPHADHFRRRVREKKLPEREVGKKTNQALLFD
jgi:hypothetical protein